MKRLLCLALAILLLLLTACTPSAEPPDGGETPDPQPVDPGQGTEDQDPPEQPPTQNETLEDGSSRGFWLINGQNQKQPLYDSFARILTDAKAYVKDYLTANGTTPSIEEYRTWLLAHEEFQNR